MIPADLNRLKYDWCLIELLLIHNGTGNHLTVIKWISKFE